MKPVAFNYDDYLKLREEYQALRDKAVSLEVERSIMAKYIAEIARERAAQGWIPVDERLPDDAFGCLLIVEDDDYWGEPRKVLLPYFAGYDGEQWNDGDGCRVRFEVTHWMPLPNPPEEKP